MTQKNDCNNSQESSEVSEQTLPAKKTPKTLEEQQAQIQRMRSSKIYTSMRTEDGDYKIKLRTITKIIRGV